jgi:hypothetical protein
MSGVAPLPATPRFHAAYADLPSDKGRFGSVQTGRIGNRIDRQDG